ncbi:MAG: LysR family transcriptional regulator [Mycobacterium sp.]|nr:LysR family transcriptional regulator [Mycobacterium sp.]
MEIRQLEYFMAVATEMNFSRAAQQIHVVQSALSVAVSKLEKELGVELFDRSRQKIRITPAGETFREHARRVIQTAQLAKNSISDYRGELTGTIEFGSLISFGELDLPKILGEFHRNHPLVRIRLRQKQAQTGLSSYLSAIADGALDLALVSQPDHCPPRITMHKLCQEPILFVCRPDHPLAQHDQLDISELAEEDLISWPTEFGLRRLIDNMFAEAGITPRILYELAADFSLAARLVQHSLGSAFMPASETRHHPGLRAMPLRQKPTWSIHLAWSSHAQGPASTKLAQQILASAALLR